MNDRLYRSGSDRMLAGVAGGLADHFDLDPSLVRVGWVILTLVSGGIFLAIYIVMAFVVPEEPFAQPGASPAAPGAAAAPGDPAAPGAAAPGAWAPAGSGWVGGPGPTSRRAEREARRAARRAGRGPGSGQPGTGGIVAGLILIGLGGYFLIRTFAPQIDLDRIWPAGLVVLGILLIALSIRRTPGSSAP